MCGFKSRLAHHGFVAKYFRESRETWTWFAERGSILAMDPPTASLWALRSRSDDATWAGTRKRTDLDVPGQSCFVTPKVQTV
jgi:hypothetical protein